MHMVSAPLEELRSSKTLAGLASGVPVAFRGNSGFFHPAGGALGVVLCSPWGFEDLTMRKSWRLLAEALAAAGYPCIRFDYPGCGDSLGRASDVGSCEEWIESVQHAADFLRFMSGVKRFVFVGQSLGAALAVAAARRRGDVVGLQLLAPVVRGRAYTRELAATSALVSQRIGVTHEATDEEALSVVGFPLSRAMVDSLKGLDLTGLDGLGAFKVTIFDQSDRKAAADLFEHFRKAGADVRFERVEPYHLMISDATTIQPLPASPERMVAALARSHPAVAFASATTAFRPSHLTTADFREDPVRFGANDALFGILCRPARPRLDVPAFVLLNRGLNPHVGWRRVSVEHARALAASGIASLRFDVAGLGESRDEPGRPANLIYSDLLLPDVAAAVDVLAGRGHARIALAGVCSGAYMALLAARQDPRVTHVFSVNPQRLVWNPAEDPEELVRYGLRSMHDYVGDIRNGRALKKLIRSRKRLMPAALYLVKRNIRNAMSRVPLAARSALLPASMAARIDAAFKTLADRGTRVALVFTPGDPGLTELRDYFGPEGRDMRYPNVSVAVVVDADHNLTATRASATMLDQMLAFATAGAPALSESHARSRQPTAGSSGPPRHHSAGRSSAPGTCA